jgi:hypothetical protein
MAEPLSIFAGVLAIATAAIQSSLFLIEITNSIKSSSKEIQAISRDAQSIYSTISSLHATLKNGNIKAGAIDDDAILEIIKSLTAPLSNCEVVLEELVVGMQKLFKLITKDVGGRTGVLNLKWALYKKNGIKDVQLRLEAAKSTLNTALSGFSVYGFPLGVLKTRMMLTGLRFCGLRLITMSDDLTNILIDERNERIDSDFAFHRLMKENANLEVKSLVSPETVIALNKSKGKMKQINETTTSREQTWNLDQCSGQETHSEGSSLGQCLGQVYQELAEHRMLLEQIQGTIKFKEKKHKGQIVNSLAEPHTLEDNSPTSKYDFVETLTRFRSERFFDCDSQFSEDDFYSLHDEWSRSCTPPPAGYFELSSSFCPERFTIEGLFRDPLFVIGEKRSTKCLWTHEYYVLYAETSRRWRKLTISANFEALPDQTSIFGLDTTHESEHYIITLPTIVEDHVNLKLSSVDQFTSVTRLSLYLERNESGLVFNNPDRTMISEDCLEVCSSGEDQMLYDIEDLGCKQFLESEIITQSRKSNSCFIVRVESRVCIERKAPFVNSGIRGRNGFQSFFNDLKYLKSLRGCRGIAEFIGVVLDDTRTHLRSYLYEYPALSSILTMFVVARSKSEVIPWYIREVWARQMVETVAEIHSGGSLVGMLYWLAEIGIRANGTIAFTAVKPSQRHFAHRPGMMPPELRGVSSTDVSTLEKMVNFRTEVFQLGLLLWMLAEHVDNIAGCFCSRSACTKSPRHMCTVDHTDPIELPSCSAGTPPYINEIIKQCRLSDPKDRKTALQLQKMFPPTKNGDDIISTHGIEILNRYARVDIFPRYCSECGSRDMSVSYRCNRCHGGDFDLCETCFEQGIPCLDPRHPLVKRIQTDHRTFKVAPE